MLELQGSCGLNFQRFFASIVALLRAAPSHSARSTLDNPVFAVIELHRFDVYIRAGEMSNSQDAEVLNDGPDVFFNAADLATPRSQDDEAFPRISDPIKRGDGAGGRGYPGNFANYVGHGRRGRGRGGGQGHYPW
jgi:hypothetical protein